MGFFDKLKAGLEKTRKGLTEKIEQLIVGYATIDDEFLDGLTKKQVELEQNADFDNLNLDTENNANTNPDNTDGNGDGGTDTNAGTDDDINHGGDANDVPEPYPDYADKIEELDQQRQAANGDITDTLDQLRELSEKFDEGELGQGAYDHQKLTLERQLRQQEVTAQKIDSSYESVVSEANEKIESYNDNQKSKWQSNILEFLDNPDNELIKNNPNVANKFDSLLENMGKSGVFEGLTQKQVLQAVRNQLVFHVPELKSTSSKPQKQQQQAKPEKPKQNGANIPATLSQMQTLEVPDQTDPYAYIRKLNGIEYEKAVGALSETELDKYLST